MQQESVPALEGEVEVKCRGSPPRLNCSLLPAPAPSALPARESTEHMLGLQDGALTPEAAVAPAAANKRRKQRAASSAASPSLPTVPENDVLPGAASGGLSAAGGSGPASATPFPFTTGSGKPVEQATPEALLAALHLFDSSSEDEDTGSEDESVAAGCSSAGGSGTAGADGPTAAAWRTAVTHPSNLPTGASWPLLSILTADGPTNAFVEPDAMPG